MEQSPSPSPSDAAASSSPVPPSDASQPLLPVPPQRPLRRALQPLPRNAPMPFAAARRRKRQLPRWRLPSWLDVTLRVVWVVILLALALVGLAQTPLGRPLIALEQTVGHLFAHPSKARPTPRRCPPERRSRGVVPGWAPRWHPSTRSWARPSSKNKASSMAFSRIVGWMARRTAKRQRWRLGRMGMGMWTFWRWPRRPLKVGMPPQRTRSANPICPPMHTSRKPSSLATRR
jgi:hypothetical protein